MLVTALPRGDSDGSIVRYFLDAITTGINSYTYETSQDNILVRNTGNTSIILNVGALNITIQPNETWQSDIVFITFTVQATSGMSEIQVTAREYDNKPVFKKDFDSQLASMTQYIVSKVIPYRHITINSAIDKWIADGMPFAVINIEQGSYKEYRNMGGLVNNNTLIFRGENKYNTIWEYGNGEYAYSCFTGGGNIQFENLTVNANHNDNPSFIEDSHSAAYAIHLDYPGAVGKMVIKNCILSSAQDSALGCGTGINQEIIVEDTELYTTAIAGLAGNHGALLYHSSNLTGQTGQKFHMKNVYAHSVSGPGMQILSSNGGNQNIDIRCINVTSRSDFYEQYTGVNYEQRCVVENANGKLIFTEDSKNNNSDKLNFIIPQIKKLTNNDGTCIITSDFNNASFGYFKTSDNPALTINTPIAGRAFSGYAIAYDPIDLSIQYAFDVLNMFTKYKRMRYSNGTFSTWIQIDNLLGTTATRNSLTSTQVDSGTMFFDTTLNKPIWRNAANTGWIDATGTTV